MLPNGWKKVKLGDVVKMSSGGTPSKDNASFWNGDIPWISALEMHKNFVEEAKLNITEDALKKGSSLAKKNDLLLLTRGSMLWKRIPVCLCLRDVAFNQDVKCLHANEKLNSTFLLYWFGCMEPKIMHMVVGTGIGAGKLESSGILDLDVNLPPLEEQKKIAATLSVWDSAIEKMEKLIEAKECGHAVLMNETLKNSKTWSCTCLSDIATIKKGKQLNAVDMISDGAYYVMNGGITPSGNTDDWNTAENTISISEGGNSCGFVAFNKEKFWAGGHCYTLIDLNENISVRFLFHYLKNMEKEIMAMRVGSGLPNIQKDSISDIKVFYPSKKGQERISGVLDDSLSEIALLKQQLENYTKQKQGLMQKLLTGQWRVK